MHREDIKAALRKAGYTLSEIAREFEVTPTTVSKIVKGSCRSRRIEAAIADKLQVPIQEVFPEKYAGLSKSKTTPCRG